MKTISPFQQKLKSKLLLATIPFAFFFTKDAAAQWTQSTLIGSLGMPATTNFYICVPDGNSWVAFGGDNGWLVNSSVSGPGIFSSNTIYNPIRAISYISSTIGVAYSGQIYTSTTNGGMNWSSVVNIEAGGPGVNDVEFVSSTGFAAANGGVVRKYVSTGSYPTWFDWQNQTLDLSVTFTSVDVLSPTHAYIAGTGGEIYRTLDGNSWTNLTTGTTANLKDISFKDANNGIAVGENGIMLMTSDGGNNWNILPQYFALDYNSVKYLSSGVIYIVGEAGLIMKSLDNGNTWGTQVSGTTYNLNSICFTGSTWFCVGDHTRFMYASASGGPITPVFPMSVNDHKKTDSNLSVYPNPFTTSANFIIDKGLNNADLIVYDILGKEVKRIEHLSGKQFTINRDDLKAGLYSYLLRDNDHLEHKGKFIVE